jgi:hypothetical protein
LVAIVGVVVVGGMAGCSVGDGNRQPTDSADAPYEPANSIQEPIVRSEPPANIREVERSRRAVRPADPKRKYPGLAYDAVVSGRNLNGSTPRPRPAEPRPPTACRSVEPAPKSADRFAGPHRVHDLTVSWFESASGFGFMRMAISENARGVRVASRVVDRVELVSLLTDYEPSVYVLDEMATPPLARVAKRRPLDKFERLGLDAVRRGENLVWSLETPTRMFGAIRARTHCLECHVNARKGDLLGAFTYYLDTPVDRLGQRRDLE